MEVVNLTELKPTSLAISLNSRFSNPKTMKMVEILNGRKLVVMVDPNATHKFVSLATVEELHVPISLSKGFGVSLGTGRRFMELRGARR